MVPDMEELRYPIGRYQRPTSYSPELIRESIATLQALPSWMDACIENLDSDQLEEPYREGGWNIRQVVHHVADSHMNAYVRFRLTVTEDTPTVKPYLENEWVKLPDVDLVPVNVSVTLLHALHRRMVSMLQHLPEEAWHRCYFHPQYQHTVPLWDAVALYAWHSRHHTAHITTLRERMGW